jgi:cation:H+ antiporter
MEDALHDLLSGLSWPLLLLVIAASFAALAQGADWLVAEAVVLSARSGIPKVVIGATIVSLGTTTPEAAVSVLAAVEGYPDLALGNAVGSIICDTGLVLGVACLIAPLPLHRKMVNRQGWVQVAAGVLLVAACWPWGAPLSAFHSGGRLHQAVGIGFVALLVAYLWQSIRLARHDREEIQPDDLETDVARPLPWVAGKLLVGLFLVVGSSWVLIPGVTVLAQRLGVPDFVLAATLVALGTSLPELVTAVTAARRGHGDLAVGNVIGADILNVLFVAGLSAAVTRRGLPADPQFFRLLFPGMLLLLVVFRVGIFASGAQLRRHFGALLLGIYAAVTALSYALE